MNTGEGMERRPANKWVGAGSPDLCWPHRQGSRGLGGGVRTCVRPRMAPGERRHVWGFPPHLKAPQRRGFLIPFSSPARCPSFNTGLISFLPPAQRCRLEHRNGPCREGEGAPAPRVTDGSTFSLIGTPDLRVGCTRWGTG